MIPESRQLIHAGINYLLAPIPNLDVDSRYRFLRALESRGITIQGVQFPGQELVVVSKTPSNLEAKVAATSQAMTGQLLAIASNPGAFEVVKDQMRVVTEAYKETWTQSPRQFLQSDVTIRALYEASDDHAFVELWVRRLGQRPEDLEELGRPVLGGGLRFVMPPSAPNQEVRDVKIESFLRDTKKIFVEAQFTWQGPEAAGSDFNAAQQLTQVDDYIKHTLVPFILGGRK